MPHIDRDLTMNDFRVGMRVEMHPCTDWWMQGDRFGYVTKVDNTNGRLRVKLDKSKRTVTVPPDLIDPGSFNPNRLF
jgi:hypothetical protein